MEERKKINRDFKQLSVWQDAISLYVLSSKMLSGFSFEFLEISLGSCGDFHSSYYSFFKADQISKDEFESLDKLHY